MLSSTRATSPIIKCFDVWVSGGQGLDILDESMRGRADLHGQEDHIDLDVTIPLTLGESILDPRNRHPGIRLVT